METQAAIKLIREMKTNKFLPKFNVNPIRHFEVIKLEYYVFIGLGAP